MTDLKGTKLFSAFDENGDVASTIEIWQIKGGAISSTGRFELP